MQVISAIEYLNNGHYGLPLLDERLSSAFASPKLFPGECVTVWSDQFWFMCKTCVLLSLASRTPNHRLYVFDLTNKVADYIDPTAPIICREEELVVRLEGLINGWSPKTGSREPPVNPSEQIIIYVFKYGEFSHETLSLLNKLSCKGAVIISNLPIPKSSKMSSSYVRLHVTTKEDSLVFSVKRH